MAAHPLRQAPPAAPAAATLRLVVPEPGLTPAEARAVDAGRREAFRTGWDAAPRPAVLRLWARLTGGARVVPFADERLELLRLFACMMRRDDRHAEAIAARLLALGVSRRALHQAIARALA